MVAEKPSMGVLVIFIEQFVGLSREKGAGKEFDESVFAIGGGGGEAGQAAGALY